MRWADQVIETDDGGLPGLGRADLVLIAILTLALLGTLSDVLTTPVSMAATIADWKTTRQWTGKLPVSVRIHAVATQPRITQAVSMRVTISIVTVRDQRGRGPGG